MLQVVRIEGTRTPQFLHQDWSFIFPHEKATNGPEISVDGQAPRLVKRTTDMVRRASRRHGSTPHGWCSAPWEAKKTEDQSMPPSTSACGSGVTLKHSASTSFCFDGRVCLPGQGVVDGTDDRDAAKAPPTPF